MPNWINNGGIYMLPRPNKVDKQQIKREMDALEAKLQIAEAAIAAREGMTA
ncbi:pilus assembly protein PilO [Sporosarcina sp. FSL W7-1283]|uniref:pilus assembly protein PilO n=1 Tax=Sporosarcina sp. FSL W7-1283 TaxID=2921560 RepID=UPI0030FA6796